MRCPTLNELPPPPPGKIGWPWTEESPRLPDVMPDGSPWPRVGIVTPSYNQGHFLEETIRSVLLQGYPDLEYVVVDAGSSDDSVAVIRRYAPWLAHWMSEPDRGQADGINKGLARVGGSILTWVNSDDILRQEALHQVAAFWHQNPSCHFLTGDGEIVDAARTATLYHIRPTSYSFADLLQYHNGKFLPQPSVFFSREALLAADYLDVDLSYALDVDLWLRIRKRYTLHRVPICLSELRSHGAAKTYKDNDRLIADVRRVVLRHLDDVHPVRRVAIGLGVGLLYASALCRRGLSDYFDERRVDAVSCLRRAIRVHPGVVLSSAGVKLALRLLLPLPIKKVLFARP